MKHVIKNKLRVNRRAKDRPHHMYRAEQRQDYMPYAPYWFDYYARNKLEVIEHIREIGLDPTYFTITKIY